MKRLLATLAALSGLAIAAATVLAPQASADASTFLAAIHADGIRGPDNVFLNEGHWVCQNIGTYGPMAAAVKLGLTDPNLDMIDQADAFVDDVIRYLCH